MTRARTLRHSSFVVWIAAALVALCGSLTPAVAQEEAEEKELGWFNNAELSWVEVGGNAESSTFSLGNETRRVWDAAELKIGLGGLRAETTTIDRFAVGTIDDYQVVTTEDSELTAENYYLRGRYDRNVSDFWFWYTGAGWERNQFAGYDSRINVAAGGGNNWHDGEVWHFRTSYGLTYTRQDDVVETPLRESGFVGYQLGYDYRHQLTGNTLLTNTLVFDGSFEESEDWRTDFRLAIAVSMTERLALSWGVDLLYYNLPPFTEVDLIGPGGDTIGSVLVPLDNLNTQMKAALVVAF